MQHPRMDGVEAHVGILHRRIVHQLRGRQLARGIGAHASHQRRGMRAAGADVHQDRVRRCVGQEGLQDVEVSAHVDVEAAHELIRVAGGQRSDIGQVAGVGDQDVYGAKLVFGGREGGVDSGCVDDVGDECEDLETGVFGFKVLFGGF